MARTILSALSVAALAWATAGAQTAPKPAPTLFVLDQAQIDPALLLPAPAADGSPVQTAELAELHQIEDRRTAARFAQAQWDSDNQNWRMFVQTLGPKFDMAALPATAKVIDTVSHDNQIASTRAKNYFHRRRPWSADKTLKTCRVGPNDDPFSSYPSGHTAYAYAVGEVLAALMPEKAQAILARSEDFAYSRLVCGLHYRSDTVGGQALGTAVAQDILNSAKMQADLAAARAELKAVGLTGG
jgi:membrane-associated phospholipid phosphatase